MSVSCTSEGRYKLCLQIDRGAGCCCCIATFFGGFVLLALHLLFTSLIFRGVPLGHYGGLDVGWLCEVGVGVKFERCNYIEGAQ